MHVYSNLGNLGYFSLVDIAQNWPNSTIIIDFSVLYMYIVDVHYSNSEGSAHTVKLCSLDVSRLKVRYLNQSPTCKLDWSKYDVFHYARLAIVEKNMLPQEMNT